MQDIDQISKFHELTQTFLVRICSNNICICIDTLQILNSLVDKFYCWDSRNETFIAHYQEKIRNHHKVCLILKKLFLTSNISNINLYSVSNSVEQVSLIILKLRELTMNLGNKLTVFSKNCLVGTTFTKI